MIPHLVLIFTIKFQFFLVVIKNVDLLSRFYLFTLERGERKEKERERNIYERNTDRLPLAHTQLGTWPATKA